MASDGFSDKNTIFRKLKAKSENKVWVSFLGFQYIFSFRFILVGSYSDLAILKGDCVFEFLVSVFFVNSDVFRL